MQTETKMNLDQSTINKLQMLIAANIDSHDGFIEAAEKMNDHVVSTLFRQLAEERSQLADELQTHVEFSGDTPRENGSVAAAVHRIWIDLRSIFSGGNAHAILCEAERGEDFIKIAYEEVLKASAGSAMNDVLQRQYTKVKAAHDRVRDLRDSLAPNSEK